MLLVHFVGYRAQTSKHAINTSIQDLSAELEGK
jgi:hypothetical protein